jgi:integrase
MQHTLFDSGEKQGIEKNGKKKRGRPWGQSDTLTKEELKLILSLPDRRTSDGLRDYAVLLVLANTPIREGELLSLKTMHLVDDGANKHISYVSLKKKSLKVSWRTIPLAEDVYSGIKRYVDMDKTRTKDSPLFYTLGKRGPYERRPLTKDAVEWIVRKYVKMSGIKKRITPHSFRATFTTLRKNMDWKALQIMGGWEHIESMMPYVRATAEQIKETALAESAT